MRWLITATAIVALSGSLARAQRVRKSIGFGPVHPHATFITNPDDIPYFQEGLTTSSNEDPFAVASTFVDVLLALDDNVRERKFFLRKDSYTDDNTGVTHAYFRQIINGLEVSDGDINVNVKDGIVLSYGDSFYRGDIPDADDVSITGVEDISPAHCSSLSASIEEHPEHLRLLALNAEQTVMGSTELDPEYARMVALRTMNCMAPASAHKLHEEVYRPTSFDDPRHAVMMFMMAATPDTTLVTDLVNRYDEHVESIQSTYETHFVGSHEVPVEYLHNVPDTINPVKVKPAYIQVPNCHQTSLKLVWKMEVEMEDNWYEAAVTVGAPHRIISVVDWASDAAFAPVPKKPEAPPHAVYNVFAWGLNDPVNATRSMEKENFDALASPMGWHWIPVANDPSQEKFIKDKKATTHSTTFGNHVFAQENKEGRNDWLNNYRPDAGPSMAFNFTYAPVPAEQEDRLDEARKYINASITQLFYTSNLVHNLYYRYGFDEKSGNFQQHNFGRGGAENDAVIANAQDGSGYNNANFMTPPDGQNGRCRMYLWNTADPYRDGDLEAGIVIHELSHGLSTRLTGGPANSGCLGWGESGGMGEGWGDFLATTIRSTSVYSDYAMGAWAANEPTGIRNYMYSLNTTVNPSTYKTLDKPGYWGVHAIGEVWAEILWVVSQRLIAKHGYSDSLFPPVPLENGTVPEGDFYRPRETSADGKEKPLVPKHGNSLMVQLVLNGMKLQPCRPSFFEARDAIIAADQILTGGENFCDLWLGFGERGLGADADVKGKTPWGGGIRSDGFKVPAPCKRETIPEPPSDDDEDEE